MSLNVKKLTPLARIPVETEDGSYEFYAGNNYIIQPGESFTVSTGLAVSLPIGYNARVYSTTAAESHNVEVSNFCSINHHSYKCTLNQTVQELKVILRNHGTTTYHIKTGDIVAKLLIHQIKKLPVHEVEELDKITQNFAVQMKMRNVKSFPSRAKTWFVMEYKNSPIQFQEKYATPEIMATFEEFKTTERYVRSNKKPTVEAEFVFEQIEKSTATVEVGEVTLTLIERVKSDHTMAKSKAGNQ